MAMAMVAALIAAPGCKDYDDDINNLREQTAEIKNDLAKAKTDLTTAIKDVEAKAAAAQKAADDAKAAADKALKDALAADAKLKAELEALADKAQKAAEAAQKTADEANKKADQLKKDLEALVKRVDDLEKNSATKTELNALRDELKKDIDKVMKAVEKFVGNRLTSISLIPTSHVGGIASTDLIGVAYKAQAHLVDHKPFTFATTGVAEGTLLPSRGEFKFRLSPRSIASDSYGDPFIDSWVTTNELRNVSEDNTGRNKPVKPLGFSVENNVLKVMVVKTIDGYLNSDKSWEGGYYLDPFCDNETSKSNVVEHYMAALGMPITEKYYTDAEKAAGAEPVVSSEGFILSERYVAPVIKSKIAKDYDYGYVDAIDPNNLIFSDNNPNHHHECYSGYFPYAYDDTPSETHYLDANQNGKKDAGERTWGLPTHFSDSTLLYNSKEDQLIDKDLEWNVTYNLMDFVDAATRDSHKTFDYAAHGLEFRFGVATAKYLQGPNNKTDQQEFAVINGTMLTNKVYSVGGQSETAVGREPIIRVQLVDKKNNKVVDQRYMKFRWVKTAEVAHIGTSTFETFMIDCKGRGLRLNTQQMNEDIYRQVEKKYGIVKSEFTDKYTLMKILELKKDDEFIVKDGKFVSAYSTSTMTSPSESNKSHSYKNLQLYFINEDQEESTDPSILPPAINAGNTSANILWTLQPEIMRDITKNGKATFTLKFMFLDRLNNKHLTHNFVVEVRIPTQEFNYEQTYWSAGKMGTEFKVNPIVYAPGNGGEPRKSEQINYDNSDVIVHGPDGHMFIGDSHIQTDLMNGFIYKGAKPANLGQFIQYIRSCAKVSFQFDKDRLGEFEHLKGFSVGADGTTLWEGTPGTPANKDFIQTEKGYAASILNFLSVTGPTNADKDTTRPWDFNEAIVNGNADKDEARALIRLHEDNASVETGVAHKGTAAAIKLVGKIVPVKIVVEYNQWNKVTVKTFDVNIIEPLKVTPGDLGSLVDAKIGGSFSGELSEKFTFTDWNKRRVANTSGEQKLLYKYYAVKTLKFHVDKVKTNIKTDENGNNVVVEGYTEGKLPFKRKFEQVKVTNKNTDPWTYVVVNENPTHLRYANEGGTPVNVPYKIFLDVESGYKWGTIITPRTIPVSPAEGTNP